MRGKVHGITGSWEHRHEQTTASADQRRAVWRRPLSRLFDHIGGSIERLFARIDSQFDVVSFVWG